MKGGFELGKVLKVVESQLETLRTAAEAAGLGFERGQARSRQRDEEARWYGFSQ
jgi:hypothetical protein